jgi:hypothetical protein
VGKPSFFHKSKVAGQAKLVSPKTEVLGKVPASLDKVK